MLLDICVQIINDRYCLVALVKKALVKKSTKNLKNLNAHKQFNRHSNNQSHKQKTKELKSKTKEQFNVVQLRISNLHGEG